MINNLETIYSEDEMDLLIQFLSYRRGLRNQQQTEFLFMHVVVAEPTFRYFVAIPQNASVNDVIAELIDTWNLPTVTPKGDTIPYRILAIDPSLGNYEIPALDGKLSEQNVYSGCELILFPAVNSI